MAIALAVGAATGQLSARPALAYVGCQYGWVYNVTKVVGSVHHDSGPRFTNWNGTATNASMTVTSTTSGSVTVTASITGTVNADAVVYGASLST
ncbi:MAG: hypothetical protein ABI959_13165, partial [Candidatus Dormiibacterota bacterium]